MEAFKYLSRIITTMDENWAEVVANIRKARKKWAWMSRILERDG